MSGRSVVQVVQLTPPGRGAIATLLVEGPGAVELLGRHFRPNSGRPLVLRPAGQLVVGRFGREPSDSTSKSGERVAGVERSEPPDRRTSGGSLTLDPGHPKPDHPNLELLSEEVVVCRRSDESVELHCHGGHAAVAMIREVLVEGGGRVVAWQDWAGGHYQDPCTAAAHIALAEARTERTAAILLDQYQGALRRALDEIEEALRNGDTPTASRQIETLLARSEVGRHLTRPWWVVLTGAVNVGKSSLINALVGYPRAIVHHTPGTTRDVLSATSAVDGWPIELSDTAGLPIETGGTGSLPASAGDDTAPACTGGQAARGTQATRGTRDPGLSEKDQADALQRAGIRRAREKLAGAELVVLVFDASLPWSEADRALIEAWPEGLVVHNKSDLPPAAGGRPPGLWTSGSRGDGIEALAQAIADRLVPHPPPAGAAVPFTAGQLERLAGYRLRAGGDKGPVDHPFGGIR